MKKFKIASVLLLVLFSSILSAGLACAADVPVDLDKIWVDGEELEEDSTNLLDIEKGDKISIRVKLNATGYDDEIQIKAALTGFEYDDRFDTDDKSHTFDVEPNATYYNDELEIEIPDLFESDDYKLRITITNRNDEQNIYNFNLRISSSRHSLKIKDVDFFPATGVEAGKSFQTKVRIKNIGAKDEESIKITVTIPDLGISGSDYIDMIESDETESTEEIWMRVPECAESGFYDAVIEVRYDELYEKVSKTATIAVTGDICQAHFADTSDEDESDDEPAFVPAPQDVVEDDSNSELLRNALEIGLIGIIIALVILGLIIGLMSLAKDKEF